jgi:hypothetical protein
MKMKNVYYILMPRGFANEADIIATKQDNEKELQSWLNEKYGANPNASYRRIKLADAKKYEKYFYDFDDYKKFKSVMDYDPTECRIYWNPR